MRLEPTRNRRIHAISEHTSECGSAKRFGRAGFVKSEYQCDIKVNFLIILSTRLDISLHVNFILSFEAFYRMGRC
ncbi:hypothetical protein [Pseudomonas sp. 58 R 3]|jgi:hypothetical protein|nr:hypothetical protein [Pseudomonas sp. 58 R 3]